MNIENLKNMPIIGEEPVAEEVPVAPIAAPSQMELLAAAVRSFQTTLEESSQLFVADSIARRDESDSTKAAADAAYWAAGTAAFNEKHAKRVQDIDDLTKSFASQIADLLGVSGVTAATPTTVFGLIESLVQENASWEDLLQADTAAANERFDTFESNIVGDIENPLNGLDFTGTVILKAIEGEVPAELLEGQAPE